jgi:hypothetical protein
MPDTTTVAPPWSLRQERYTLSAGEHGPTEPPRRRARGHCAVTAPSARALRQPAWISWITVLLDQANIAGPRARKPATIFWFLIFI